MKKFLFMVFAYCLLSMAPFSQVAADAERGKEFFNDVQGGNCRTCHSMTSTKLVGPGLRNVMVRHTEEWMRSFISDPQKTWETDHPETIELKKRARAMRNAYTRCQKAPMSDQTKDDLIDFFNTLTVKK